MRKKTGERVGEIAGLTSGATVGLVVAGPVGGLIGAVIGEAVGGQLGEDAVRNNSAPSCSSQSSPQASTARWLDKFGRSTLGESMIILAGGTIGSIFGPSGRAVGQRIGIIVGKRVEWYELGTSHSEPQSEPRTHLLHEGSAGDDSQLSEESELVREMVLSDREAEIVALHAAGFSDKQIAGQLAIGPDTVKVHMDRICAKLGVETSEEVAAKAVLFLPLSDPTDESVVASAAKLMP
jgi:DNA-binding CsgD family transcriptional regulator